MYPKLLIIIRENQFLVQDINFSHFCHKKRPKKTNLKIQNLSPPTKKLIQKPLFRYFMIGILIDLQYRKSQIFWAQLDQKLVLKLPILFGGGKLKAPLLVGLITIKKFIFSQILAFRDFLNTSLTKQMNYFFGFFPCIKGISCSL